MNLKPSPFAPKTFPKLPPVKGVRSATTSRGFYAGRGLDRDDVFLFAFDEGTHCAGVFTRSRTASADVQWCRQALTEGGQQARALIVNSGNSNAFTGPKGVEKNTATLKALVETLGVTEATCFIGATGVVGEPLADPNFVGSSVPEMYAQLAAPDWQAAAKAFMTTDTFAKGAGTALNLDGVDIGIAGIAKGSGMIMPDMATMLSYIFTDAAVARDVLQELLNEIVAVTFNAITVDGDTSTSDTLMVFATGASGAPEITSRADPRFADFAAALHGVIEDLALQIVKDGEGASKFVSIMVEGATTPLSAKKVGMAVANSPLIKTAMAANDANWGRVVMAVGKSMEPIDQNKLAIWFDDVQVAKDGARATDYDEEKASAVFARDSFQIRIGLGVGTAAFKVWTCDLTHGYVDINGAYRT
ncbi:MAG: bifunctional glutamate N-acetyltransferase/amino-acid acetyltransferase ArgJ [Hyphomonas sp.]